MRTVGFGIVGCGMISRFHAAAIESVDDARLVGVFDPVPETAERAAHAYGTRRFDSLEEMLACKETEAVCVCTPNGLHAPIALKALDAGRHVVIEKPMALTLKDADEIARAALRQNLCVSVISQLRFSPAIQAVKQALEEKRLGKVVSASLAMKYWRDSAYYASSNWRGTWAMDGGGALMNQGIHGVDLLQYLAGPVCRLTAVCKTQTKKIEVEDSAAAVLEFENGAVGTLEGSTTCRPGYPRRLEICGDLGSVVLEEEDILRWDVPGEAPTLPRHESCAAADPSAIDSSGHERQLRNVVHAIRGEEPLWIDAAEGRKPVEIILAVYESSRLGRPVELQKGEAPDAAR